MRKLAAPVVLFICLLAAPAAADAAIPNVFGSVTCTIVTTPGPQLGQRQCGSASGTTTPTWDGTPIDVSVTFPPASGGDNNYPVVGVYHGWAGSKITPTSTTTQRWVAQGYAVFSMTDRGFFASCGVSVPAPKPAACAHGYIHLMHNEYEVRDAQYLLGRLADEGVIDPQRVGATGGSYGGGMSAQLGALKDRTVLEDGSKIQWQSPGGIPMKIAATAPEFPWTDLAEALQPNGSTLDYVADAPYLGVNGDHRFGIQKQNWNGTLFLGGGLTGFYAPTSGAGFPDPEANLVQWNTANGTGGPYDGQPLVNQQINELPKHSAYYTDDSEIPAPALLSSGWNDDLFPVDQTVKYYNKVRSDHPDAAMKLFYLDFGHSPRAPAAAATSATDFGKLVTAENAWFNYYIRGIGSEPADARGGVDALTSSNTCPLTAAAVGQQFTAPNWASLAPGEIRLIKPDPQTIVAPGTAPAQAFTSANICTTQAAGDNASAATYKTDPAPVGGYTVLGASTVIAEFDTPAANDQIVARLYDVDPADGQKLIGRATYRPTNVGEGFKKQVFQLHPQGFKILAGHIVKLELLVQDSTYARTSSSPHSIGVRNLELRIPTADAPGSAGGMVQAPAAKYLPPGYELARVNGISRPGAPHVTAGVNPNATGLFRLGWTAAVSADTIVYTLQHRDSDDSDWSTVDGAVPANSYEFVSGTPEGEGTWKYRDDAHLNDATDPTGYSDESAAIKVDKTKPAAPTISARAPDYAGDGGWYKDTVDVTITDNGDPALFDGSDGSGVDVGSIPPVANHSASGSYTHNATVKDAVGNESDPATPLTVQVDATDPSLSVTCPSAVLLHAPGVTGTIAASDGESGIVSDPSGTFTVDTSTVGPKTKTSTVTDNVGHEVTKSCTTDVQYMFGGLQQPINPDGSSIFKLGSAVPAKFHLTDAAGNGVSGVVARLEVAKVTSNVEGNYVESVSPGNSADATNVFKDQGGGDYHLNLSTKNLSTGTWSLKVVLDDETEYKTRISLR